MAERVSELYAAIGAWALHHGHANIKERVTLGDLYRMEDERGDGIVVFANPTAAPVRGVLPWAFLIERNGMPLAMVDPLGGECLAGSEADLIARFKTQP